MKIEKPPECTNFSYKENLLQQLLPTRMASEMSITQDFRQLTLTLPADSVMVNIDIKMLKGQYTYSLNNNYTDLSFTPWNEDHEPSEMFLRIVRETQIIPNSYYLEMVMNQSLVNNFAIIATDQE